MSKFYINNKSKIFRVKSGSYTEIAEMSAFYRKLINAELKDVSVNGETIRTIWNQGTEVIFDMSVFDNKYNIYDDYISNLQSKINLFLENKSLKEFKKKFPQRNSKINRRKSINICPLIAGSLATITILTISIRFQKVQTEGINLGPNTIPNVEFDYSEVEELGEQTILKKEMDILEQNVNFDIPENSLAINNYEEENRVTCIFPFEVKEDGKFETTIQNCAPYAEEYIARYGLPRDLTYALICQESGSLTSIDERIGTVNPMRIDPKEMNGEFFKVPVYENGAFTGEYDCFYAVATEADKNNPKYAGYKVLAIDNLKEHFQIGCAYIRRGIDRYKNIWIGLDSNNKGLYAFSNVYEKGYVTPEHNREYYQDNPSDFSWINLIAEHYKVAKKDPDFVYGDPIYLANVLRYLPLKDGKALIEYDYKGETIVIELVNELLLDNVEVENYNNGQQRG